MPIRRYALLLGSLLVVALLGGLAAWSDHGAANEAQSVHAGDRAEEQQVLSGLTGQYLQFTFLATDTAARTTTWSLRAGDRADRARLAAFVRSSPLTGFGAALVTIGGTPLTAYPSASALPGAENPGYGPLRAALLAGRPGLSSVMVWHGRPLVGFAVPVRRDGRVAALFVAYADARTWPLEGYVQKLDLGPSSVPYTVDSTGTIAAAPDPDLVGRRMAMTPAMRAVAAGQSGTVTYVRDGVRQFTSYAPAGVGGWSALSEQHAAQFSGSLPRRHDEEVLALVALLTFAVVLLVVFHHKRQRALQAVAESRLYDPLTGLGQRALFRIRLDGALARFRRTHAPMALFYCDLDDFKQVNDRLGHNAGDQLLTAVAQRLKSAVRDEDVVARIGGDEFAIVVENVRDLVEVHELAARVRALSAAPLTLAGQELTPSVSVGVALLTDPSRADDLVHEADLAMYAAKTGHTPCRVTVLGPVETSEVPSAATVDVR
jgi:diguanylate cyclase (GGDEF)-like protein